MSDASPKDVQAGTPAQREDLRFQVEQALGFALSAFQRLPGGSTPNYRAVRASDGFPFLVKLLPPVRAWVAPVLRAHLDEMVGTKCVRRLFPEAPECVGASCLICLEWCDGARKMPHHLREDELRRLLDDYVELSAALQKATYVAAADPLPQWRTRLLSLTGWRSAPLRKMVAHEVPAEEIVRRPESTCVIFGDFHHGNFVFRDGRVHRFFDLESFSYGCPTEDLVRYYTCAFEHLPLGGFGYRRRLLRSFETAVRHLPYSKADWLLALDAQILRKCEGYSEADLGLWRVVNLLLRVRLYRDMKKVVWQCK